CGHRGGARGRARQGLRDGGRGGAQAGGAIVGGDQGRGGVPGDARGGGGRGGALGGRGGRGEGPGRRRGTRADRGGAGEVAGEAHAVEDRAVGLRAAGRAPTGGELEELRRGVERIRRCVVDIDGGEPPAGPRREAWRGPERRLVDRRAPEGSLRVEVAR